MKYMYTFCAFLKTIAFNMHKDRALNALVYVPIQVE